ncbi:MAG: hypothetical protein M0T80_00385 [Actinomycetota bacterium]|nr:hypothetical protein [Actinomycetota bacterium]
MSTGERRGRTGAEARAVPGEPELTSYRGVEWRKDPDGTIGWYNDEAGGWLRWRPGADAPPLPPRFEPDAAAIPLPPRLKRASWRSPYRLVPVVLVAAAVALGVWQAGREGGVGATALARREARALVGHCLPHASSPSGAQVADAFSTSPVGCSSRVAEVRVVSVHQVTVSRPRPRCGPGQMTLQLAYVGTRTPDVECAVALPRH